jgi:aryl-alcohol dehydrogenase-like predicted oxidoreductase
MGMKHFGLFLKPAQPPFVAHIRSSRSQQYKASTQFARETEPEVLPTCQELAIGTVSWTPLGQGFLTGKIAASTKFESADFRAVFPRFTEEARKETRRW